MADGGFDPTDPTEKTPLIPKEGNDDDDTGTDNTGVDWDNIDLRHIPADPEPDRRNPFEPTASSTPAGERIALKTRTRTRLPPPRNKEPLTRPLSVQGLIKALKPTTAW